jgi:hypothetical protein
LTTDTRTVRPGHRTPPIVTFSGTRGVTDGAGGVLGCPVGVWEAGGRRLGDADAFEDFDAEAEAEAETCGDGVLLAAWDGDEEFISIGITRSAPTTKNTAAMATLDSCIGSSGGWGHFLDLGPYSADYPCASGA